MQKMKKYRIAGMALLMIFTFTACLNDDDPQFEIVGADVYIIKKKVNDEIKYAPTYYLYANQGMTSVTVTVPNGGGTIDLDGTAGGVVYGKEPADADFSTTIPEEGNYLFTAVSSKSETLTANDEFEMDDLAIPVINSLEFVSGSLEVSWNEVSGADGYYFRILDASGDLVGSIYSIDNDVTEYTITGSTGEWEQTPSAGEIYTIELNAYSFDSDATQYNSGYNVQEIAIGQSQITWE